jgi:hypothetical protein
MSTDDLLDKLDESFSYVGTSMLWKTPIGNRVIWMCPISFMGQMHVNEVMSDESLGQNLILETKRVTLSYAIVGIDDLDLTGKRDSFEFPIKDKSGKVVKTSLQKYIYEKIRGWSGQYVDDAFAVYADLTESHQKENLKEVKFQNARDPRDELSELEEKAADMRRQIGMPELVEKVDPSIKEEFFKTEGDERKEEAKPVMEEEQFDPFKTVKTVDEEPDPVPVVKKPDVISEFAKQGITVHNPNRYGDEVVEHPTSFVDQEEPPAVDPHRNPRFSRP